MTDQSPQSTGRGQTEWQLARLDVRAPIAPVGQTLVRVELTHPVRGRVGDIASASSALDGALQAVSNILRKPARLRALNIAATSGATNEGLTHCACLTVETEDELRTAIRADPDLLHACVLAFMAALDADSDVSCTSMFSSPRPHQVIGIDENEDLWTFASSDAGAAEAIAQEFRAESFRDVRRL